MLRLSVVASLAAAALAQTPPTWISTNYYSGATCTGAPTAGHVDAPSVWALANGAQHTSCAADYSGGGYSTLTCTNGVAFVQKYKDNTCTTPQSPAVYDVPACTPNDSTWGTYGQTCGTGVFPASGSGLGLATNTIVAGYGESCSAAPGGFIFTAVPAFGACIPIEMTSTNKISVQATCAGGVLTGNAYVGTTCTGAAVSIAASCVTINGLPVTFSCTTPPAKSGAGAVVAGVVATVAAAAAAVALV